MPTLKLSTQKKGLQLNYFVYQPLGRKRAMRRKKKLLIKNFRPKLRIRRFNGVRLPGGIYGAIYLRYLHDGKNRGYRDFRDYLTDIANRGLERVIVEDRNDVEYPRLELIMQKRDDYTSRVAIAKVDLNAIDLVAINQLCISQRKIDLYDCISFLILIGWSHINGGVDYQRVERHEKIFC